MPKPIMKTTGATEQDRLRAATASRMLSDGQDAFAELPELIKTLLIYILDETAQGRAVEVMPVENYVSTSKAADYLNVSRPYLVRLLDEGKIPHRFVGAHRRIHLNDLKEYKEMQDKQSYELMAQLQEQAQELHMGY